MINALKLCSLALNPQSPSPTATLVKVEDGYATAYGGRFCIRVPVTEIIGAAFDPKVLATFFRKERKAHAYTIKFPKLTISEGKERLTIHCLPAEDVITIDNIETPIPCTLNLANVKRAAELCVTEGPIYSHGVTFREGTAMATNNNVFFCGQSDLPEEFSFIIDREAVLALAKFPSALKTKEGKVWVEDSVVAISKNDHTVKFIFKSGASLCAHILEQQIPEIGRLFEGDWQPFTIKEDITDLACERIQIRQGSLFYHTEKSVGELENAVEGDVEFYAAKKSFDFLLGGELSFNGTRLQSVGDDWAVISSVLFE